MHFSFTSHVRKVSPRFPLRTLDARFLPFVLACSSSGLCTPRIRGVCISHVHFTLALSSDPARDLVNVIIDAERIVLFWLSFASIFLHSWSRLLVHRFGTATVFLRVWRCSLQSRLKRRKGDALEV